ncbi:hypothetical protein WJX72_011243 [[Myrmecia] bisecta]|uniref:Uncharacterized protein n=1 Tax=[Myrmecia] bisecta TaxID=41462 RepID=A0AAW1QA38_9CHLO
MITAVATYFSLRQGKPGTRLAVEPHGGHLWSNQEMLQRPLDITSLRIDHQERMTLQLADYVLSPTQYMLSCLRLRGWTLPSRGGSRVLPNVVALSDAPAPARVSKPVWRLAFYARLEERKGIKQFVEAVDALDAHGLDKFEVWIIGLSQSSVQLYPLGSGEQPEGFASHRPSDPVGDAAAPAPCHFLIDQALSLQPGDMIDVSVDPRMDHSCDGVLVNSFEIWDVVSLAV